MGAENPCIAKDVYDKEIEYITSRGKDRRDVEENLVGLALSGGGIRSATFSLGVLEGLKSLGLLKKIDYLSTVSGGGYIGAWLSANCKRAAQRKTAPQKPPADSVKRAAYDTASKDWLDKDTPWEQSIAHLRRHSNYLSPKLGLFSADTWSMAAIWLRNTLLIQLTVVLAIAMILLPPRLLIDLFIHWPQAGAWRWTSVVLFILAVAGIAGNQLRLNRDENIPFVRNKNWGAGIGASSICLGAAWWMGYQYDFDPFTNGPINIWVALPVALLLVIAGFYLLPVALKLLSALWPGSHPPKQINYTQGWVQIAVVAPMMAVAYLVAAILWGLSGPDSHLFKINSFRGFFLEAWEYWPLPLSVTFASLWLLSICSIKSRKGLLVALFAPIPAVLALHALLCVIMLIMHGWAHPADSRNAGGVWHAFIWAPAMVQSAFTLAIIILIGMMGRQATESVREWWSRLGAWLAIYGAAWMLIAVVALYGPKVAAIILDSGTWQGISLGGWLATTLAGLLAGKSEATGGASRGGASEKTAISTTLELVATIGPFVFIAGLLLGIATALHLIIVVNSGHDLPGIAALRSDHWNYLNNYSQMEVVWILAAAVGACLLLMGWRFDINEFSLNGFYRSRLARCYLGATRFLPGERNPQRFTGFDADDDILLADLRGAIGSPPAGPLHIVNCALNLGGSSDLALHTRHSASFTLTPYVSGSDYKSRDPFGVKAAKPLGYEDTAEYGGEQGQPTLGQAISVSGAAASPNMGFHTSPVVAFMLTVFNVRLGWWFPNPRKHKKSPSPLFSLRYLLKELFGGADDKSDYLMISDGGHFENLAAYELIRRRCRVIIISDAECDPELKFDGLGTLIRMCEVDFGVGITLNVDAIRPNPESNWSSRRHAVGRIHYGNGIPDGILIYLKASMTGQEDTSVLQYKAGHPIFPHESTNDQFYGEDQFESYRRLGREVAESTFATDTR